MEKLVGLALVVQILVEAWSRKWPRGTVYVAIAVGMLVAVLTGTGLLAGLGYELPWPGQWAVWADFGLAGAAFAAGAGVVQRLKGQPNNGAGGTGASRPGMP